MRRALLSLHFLPDAGVEIFLTFLKVPSWLQSQSEEKQIFELENDQAIPITESPIQQNAQYKKYKEMFEKVCTG